MRRIIVRGDDCGADRASTYGILKCVEAGLLRNVSFMAVENEIETAAEAFRGHSDICMGFHFTIFSEWDRVKWNPVSPGGQIRTLLDKTACSVSVRSAGRRAGFRT